MHGYTVEPDRRRPIQMGIFVVAFIITTLCVPHLPWVLEQIARFIGLSSEQWKSLEGWWDDQKFLWNPLEFPTIWWLVYLFYDRWLWRIFWPNIPDFSGIWLGSYQDQNASFSRQFRFRIKQRWSNIQVAFEGPDAVSASVSVVVRPGAREAQEALQYVFRSKSKAVDGQPGGSEFVGTAHLSWLAYPNDLIGRYHTDLGEGRLGGANTIKRATAIRRDLKAILKHSKANKLAISGMTFDDGDVHIVLPSQGRMAESKYTVETSHAYILSSVFRQVSISFGSALEGSLRIEAFHRMTNVANVALSDHPKTNKIALIECVVREAEILLAEMEHGPVAN